MFVFLESSHFMLKFAMCDLKPQKQLFSPLGRCLKYGQHY